ncbi:hypothetical protein DFH06DRAFT_1303478 [Mycena polygramma]|nr:hypothetical protein DFH06DRAFT_1303478 [Mycena polygramma]
MRRISAESKHGWSMTEVIECAGRVPSVANHCPTDVGSPKREPATGDQLEEPGVTGSRKQGGRRGGKLALSLKRAATGFLRQVREQQGGLDILEASWDVVGRKVDWTGAQTQGQTTGTSGREKRGRWEEEERGNEPFDRVAKSRFPLARPFRKPLIFCRHEKSADRVLNGYWRNSSESPLLAIESAGGRKKEEHPPQAMPAMAAIFRYVITKATTAVGLFPDAELDRSEFPGCFWEGRSHNWSWTGERVGRKSKEKEKRIKNDAIALPPEFPEVSQEACKLLRSSQERKVCGKQNFSPFSACGAPSFSSFNLISTTNTDPASSRIEVVWRPSVRQSVSSTAVPVQTPKLRQIDPALNLLVSGMTSKRNINASKCTRGYPPTCAVRQRRRIRDGILRKELAKNLFFGTRIGKPGEVAYVALN